MITVMVTFVIYVFDNEIFTLEFLSMWDDSTTKMLFTMSNNNNIIHPP